MHYLKPPLIHRDLKVENILQASLTNFKLCDFGSAVAVPPRAPSATADLRALEADINRHTTFQYRAPEMVDVYLRRPVDEKSGMLNFYPSPWLYDKMLHGKQMFGRSVYCFISYATIRHLSRNTDN